MFLPLVGGIIYLITLVFNKQDAQKIQSEVTHIINPTKKIKDLEKQLKFSDTYSNRMALADAYFEIEAYKDAIEQYQYTLKDLVQDDAYARQKVVEAHYKLGEYLKVINEADPITERDFFKGSGAEFYFGLALYHLGQIESGIFHLKNIDRPYSNHNERLELAKIYLEIGDDDEAKTILIDITNEAENMTKTNRHLFAKTIRASHQLLTQTMQ